MLGVVLKQIVVEGLDPKTLTSKVRILHEANDGLNMRRASRNPLCC